MYKNNVTVESYAVHILGLLISLSFYGNRYMYKPKLFAWYLQHKHNHIDFLLWIVHVQY